MIERSHLGAYGLIMYDEAILLIRKARGPYTGLFDLPGGKIEFGESPMAALRREVVEETGLHVCSAMLIDGLSHRVQYQHTSGEWIDLHHLGFLYRVEIKGATPLRSEGDGEDSHGALWLPIVHLTPATLSPFAQMALARARCISS